MCKFGAHNKGDKLRPLNKKKIGVTPLLMLSNGLLPFARSNIYLGPFEEFFR